MKAERRHELKENDLAHYMDQAATYMRKNGSRLGLIVAGVVVVAAVVSIAVRSRAVAAEDAWQRKLGLDFTTPENGKQSLQSLATLTATSSDKDFVIESLLQQGRYALELAHKAENPPDQEMNEKARDAYQALVDRFPRNPIAYASGRMGLATVEENAFSLDRDAAHKEAARRHLQAVLDRKDLETTPFYKLASDRLEIQDEVFTVTRFAAAPAVPEEPVDADPVIPGLPAGVKAVPISADEVPDHIRKQAEGENKGSGSAEDGGTE